MNSYRQIIYHIIFLTKKRKPSIEERYCHDLYRYIGGIIKKRNSIHYEINGAADHIHILSDLHPAIALADLIKEIKLATSGWLKQSGKFPHFDGWQQGYAAFTYSIKEKPILLRYVQNQKTHHHTEPLEAELKRLLKEHEIEYDERYLL